MSARQNVRQSTREIEVTPARAQELETVLALVDEVARGLLARGIQQWQSPPPASLCWVLEQEVAAGNVFLARLPSAATPIGILRLAWQRDPMWPTDKPAAYVYTLAVRPEFTGQGLGAALLDWAGAHAGRLGRQWLRLDCLAQNAHLRAYYARLGFAWVGLSESQKFALFEKPITPVLGT